MGLVNCNLRRGLFLASQSGNVKELHALLAQLGADADLGFVQQPEGNTPLHVACICGHEEVVRVLLEHGGAPVDARDAEGRTPLYVASMGGHIECVRLLLEPPPLPAEAAAAHAAADGSPAVAAPASIELRSHAGLSALFVAAWRGHRDVVSLLRAQGADVIGPRDPEGRHMWQLAREWNHAALADELEQAARAVGWTPEKDAPVAAVDGADAVKDVVLDLSAVVKPSPSPEGAVQEHAATAEQLEQQHQLQQQLPHAHQSAIAVH